MTKNVFCQYRYFFEKALNTIIDTVYHVIDRQGGERKDMLVKKAVVIAIVALFLIVSLSSMASSREFLLGALRLKMFLDKPMIPTRVHLINISVEKIEGGIIEKDGDGHEGQIANGEMKKIDDSLIPPPPKPGGKGILENGEMKAINGSLVKSNDSNGSIIPPGNNNSGIPEMSGNMQKVNDSIIVTPTTNGCIATGGQECIVPPPFKLRLREIFQKIIQRWRENKALPTIAGLDYII